MARKGLTTRTKQTEKYTGDSGAGAKGSPSRGRGRKGASGMPGTPGQGAARVPSSGGGPPSGGPSLTDKAGSTATPAVRRLGTAPRRASVKKIGTK